MRNTKNYAPKYISKKCILSSLHVTCLLIVGTLISNSAYGQYYWADSPNSSIDIRFKALEKRVALLEAMIEEPNDTLTKSHSGGTPTPSAVLTNKSQLNAPKDPNKIKIIFLRPSEKSLITWDYKILINGKPVGIIQDEYVASYEMPAGKSFISLSGALYEFPVLKISGNSGATYYIYVGREGNGYTGYKGILRSLETQEGEGLYNALRKEKGDD
jgi:hypothetical protein